MNVTSHPSPSSHAVLDLFSGHGWGFGARALGATDLGVDNNPDVNATREANGLTVAYRDAWFARGPEHYDLLPFDTLLASPPCQTFSLAGQMTGHREVDDIIALVQSGVWRDTEHLFRASYDFQDARTALILLPLHYAWRYRPEYVAMEQVIQVTPIFEAIAERLRQYGYSAKVGRFHTEAHGLGQSRKRALLIAAKNGNLDFPTPTHSRWHRLTQDRQDPGVLPWVTMSDALGWGDEITEVVTTFGGNPKPSRIFDPRTRPAQTLTSHVRSWGVMTPDGRRPITVAEAARLQGYPDGVVFVGSNSSIFRQIGNAVAPVVAARILAALWGTAEGESVAPQPRTRLSSRN